MLVVYRNATTLAPALVNSPLLNLTEVNLILLLPTSSEGSDCLYRVLVNRSDCDVIQSPSPDKPPAIWLSDNRQISE